MKKQPYLFFLTLHLFLSSCAQGPDGNPSNEFRNYYYQGKAEINSYSLEQARYGEMRSGTAVLIFVTEDFSLKELTKATAGNGKNIPVIKCNFEKKFETGIYPYSMLSTVVTPVDPIRFPHSIKLSASVLEWCGMAYMQWNLSGSSYKMISHSYFPGEGDESANLKPVFLEDEIWTKIRLGSEFLPVGELEILPSAFYQRLLHRPHQAVKAFAILKKDNAVSGEMIYSVEYTEPARKLEIHFQEKFPFIIQGWEETYQDGFGSEAPVLTTRATRLNTEMLEYWKLNHNQDSIYRKKFELK